MTEWLAPLDTVVSTYTKSAEVKERKPQKGYRNTNASRSTSDTVSGAKDSSEGL